MCSGFSQIGAFFECLPTTCLGLPELNICSMPPTFHTQGGLHLAITCCLAAVLHATEAKLAEECKVVGSPAACFVSSKQPAITLGVCTLMHALQVAPCTHKARVAHGSAPVPRVSSGGWATSWAPTQTTCPRGPASWTPAMQVRALQPRQQNLHYVVTAASLHSAPAACREAAARSAERRQHL